MLYATPLSPPPGPPGYNVLLVLTPDHSRMVRAAIRMARLFVHNIVDRLHCVVVAQEAESKVRRALAS